MAAGRRLHWTDVSGAATYHGTLSSLVDMAMLYKHIWSDSKGLILQTAMMNGLTVALAGPHCEVCHTHGHIDVGNTTTLRSFGVT